MRPSGDALVADGGFLSRGKVLEVPDSLDTNTKKGKLLFISLDVGAKTTLNLEK